MIKALFGPSSLAATLRRGLDMGMAAHNDIARRVASAATSSSQTAPLPGEDAEAAQAANKKNLADDMADLAEVQLRYEAEAKLLHAVYQNWRTSIRGNG